MRLASVSLCVCLCLASEVAAQADPFEPVAPLVRQREDARALAALGRLPRPVREGPRGRYLRGRLLERLGRWAAAAEAGMACGMRAPT